MSWFASSNVPTKNPFADTSSSVPGIDLSKATFTGDYLEQLQRKSAEALQQAQKSLAAQTSSTWTFRTVGILLGLGILGFLLALLINWIAVLITGKDLPGLGWLNFGQPAPSAPSGAAPSQILYISTARYGTDSTAANSVDVSSYLTSQIVAETTLPAFTVGYASLGLSEDPYPGKLKTLYVQYYVGTSAYINVQAADGTPLGPLPSTIAPPIPGGSVGAQQAMPPKSMFSKIYNSIFGDSSGDLAPSYHDASSSVIVKGSEAPLSAESEGGYGMQWWMYVKDWNYGYGKKKSVVKRPDPTNSAVTNPHISLHPTDNTLQISVSVFPATEGGASKASPAPAGHSGSTDDVFVCEVPNIPLQTWFSVSVTVFGRNLDVYIDGKLVKSCFLTGVPKPAVGDIQLTPEGGFSGRICNFYHYPRMLTPSDAMTFWSSGTSCRSKTESGITGKATGYSVKFGVYDTLGKEVQEYTF